MDSRRLNRKVLLQQLVGTQDEAGQPVTTWENLIATGDGKVWANIKHLSGVETIKSEAPTSVVKVSIRIRYRTDVTAAIRVVHGSTTYEIKAVMPDEAGRQHLDLACEVVTGSA
jgi:SPP1 family predicted phage head-tail adaptor